MDTVIDILIKVIITAVFIQTTPGFALGGPALNCIIYSKASYWLILLSNERILIIWCQVVMSNRWRRTEYIQRLDRKVHIGISSSSHDWWLFFVTTTTHVSRISRKFSGTVITVLTYRMMISCCCIRHCHKWCMEIEAKGALLWSKLRYFILERVIERNRYLWKPGFEEKSYKYKDMWL